VARGGFTRLQNGNADVLVSGFTYQVQAKDGGALSYGPEDVLMHELVSHAFPYTLGPETGMAVETENIYRRDAGLRERKPNNEPELLPHQIRK